MSTSINPYDVSTAKMIENRLILSSSHYKCVKFYRNKSDDIVAVMSYIDDGRCFINDKEVPYPFWSNTIIDLISSHFNYVFSD